MRFLDCSSEHAPAAHMPCPIGLRLLILVALTVILQCGCSLWPAHRDSPSPSASKAEPTRFTQQQAADVRFALARSLEQQGRLEAALPIYRELIEADPRHGEAAHRLAILYDRQENYGGPRNYSQRPLP